MRTTISELREKMEDDKECLTELARQTTELTKDVYTIKINSYFCNSAYSYMYNIRKNGEHFRQIDKGLGAKSECYNNMYNQLKECIAIFNEIQLDYYKNKIAKEV